MVFADSDYASKAADKRLVSGGIVICDRGGVFGSRGLRNVLHFPRLRLDM